MEESSRALSDQEIIELFRSGKMTDYIFGHQDFEEKLTGVIRYVDLHNTGMIDLFSLTRGQEFESVKPTAFFAGQHFFCQAIPHLQASTSEMMICVDQLVTKAGNDLAANQPNAAFRDWCSQDLARAKAIVDAAEQGDQLALKFITFALEAGKYFDDAIRLLGATEAKVRLSAITAISRITLTKERAHSALGSFLTLVETEDDVGLANILSSAFEIVKNATCGHGELSLIVEAVCRKLGPQVNYSLARCLWMYPGLVGEAMFAGMATALQTVDPSHKATINQLDSGLRHLLDTPLADKGVELLRRILEANPQTISISEFEGFGHNLIKRTDGIVPRTLISWLLSGERVLCESLGQLISATVRADEPITIDAQYTAGLSSVQRIFVCRKAIGYFFLHPVFAASILVSALRTSSAEDADVIAGLLVDPLLRNYGGKLREFLAALDEGDVVLARVRSCLSKAELYLADVRSVGEINELRPSEIERQATHRKDADQIRRTHKEAMGKSVLMSMVRHSVVLYGKRTITYVEDMQGGHKAVEMDLKSHSFGWEVPRTSIIDPVGLDYMLRVFRNERMR